eukprot:7151526-Pyramimonas_sp.AAC.1
MDACVTKCNRLSAHLVVADEVARDADGVVEGALGLVEHHLVAAAHEDGHRLRVLALLDVQHAVLRVAKRHLAHAARLRKPEPPRPPEPHQSLRSLRDGFVRPVCDGRKIAFSTASLFRVL